VSISDVSYDSYDDEDNSLLNFMQVIRKPTKPSQSTNPQGKGETPVSNPNNEINHITGDKPSAGAIVGAVFGSLIGLLVLGAFGFIGYRYRKEQPKSFSTFLKSLSNRKGYSSSGNHGALSEMASDTTNQRVIDDNTATVIPILKSLPNLKGFSSSGNHGALSEMASDTTNQRVINNNTATVIPILKSLPNLKGFSSSGNHGAFK
jgi:hypothetical protein